MSIRVNHNVRDTSPCSVTSETVNMAVCGADAGAGTGPDADAGASLHNQNFKECLAYALSNLRMAQLTTET